MEEINSLFNFALAITASAMLWNIVHPEHFDWLREIWAGRRKGKEIIISNRTERIIIVVFVVLLIALALFSLHSLLTRGTY